MFGQSRVMRTEKEGLKIGMEKGAAKEGQRTQGQ